MSCVATRHGTPYARRKYGCDCPEALESIAREKAAYRRRRYLERSRMLVDNVGTRRRIQALMRIGWPVRTIAKEAGYATQGSLNAALYRSPLSHVDTIARIRAVYDRLSMTPGPSARTRMLAERKDWPPPLAWDDDTIDDPKARPQRDPRVRIYRYVDEIAVEEACAGRPVTLTDEERREAVRRLKARGYSNNEVAERLHILPDAAQKLISRTRHRDLHGEAKSDHCPKGHDYRDPDVYGIKPTRGERYCRACQRDRRKAAA